MTLTRTSDPDEDAAVKLARGTCLSLAEARTCLARLKTAGANLDQAVALMHCWVKLHGPDRIHVGPTYWVNHIADALAGYR